MAEVGVVRPMNKNTYEIGSIIETVGPAPDDTWIECKGQSVRPETVTAGYVSQELYDKLEMGWARNHLSQNLFGDYYYYLKDYPGNNKYVKISLKDNVQWDVYIGNFYTMEFNLLGSLKTVNGSHTLDTTYYPLSIYYQDNYIYFPMMARRNSDSYRVACLMRIGTGGTIVSTIATTYFNSGVRWYSAAIKKVGSTIFLIYNTMTSNNVNSTAYARVFTFNPSGNVFTDISDKVVYPFDSSSRVLVGMPVRAMLGDNIQYYIFPGVRYAGDAVFSNAIAYNTILTSTFTLRGIQSNIQGTFNTLGTIYSYVIPSATSFGELTVNKQYTNNEVFKKINSSSERITLLYTTADQDFSMSAGFYDSTNNTIYASVQQAENVGRGNLIKYNLTTHEYEHFAVRGFTQQGTMGDSLIVAPSQTGAYANLRSISGHLYEPCKHLPWDKPGIHTYIKNKN